MMNGTIPYKVGIFKFNDCLHSINKHIREELICIILKIMCKIKILCNDMSYLFKNSQYEDYFVTYILLISKYGVISVM